MLFEMKKRGEIFGAVYAFWNLMFLIGASWVAVTMSYQTITMLIKGKPFHWNLWIAVPLLVLYPLLQWFSHKGNLLCGFFASIGHLLLSGFILWAGVDSLSSSWNLNGVFLILVGITQGLFGIETWHRVRLKRE